VQILQEWFVVPSLPNVLPPAGNDLVPVAPGVGLFPDSGVVTGVAQVMDDPILFVKKQRAPAFYSRI
jgi:hypothetical protein